MESNYLQINKHYEYTPKYLQNMNFILNEPKVNFKVSSLLKVNDKKNIIMKSNRSKPYEINLKIDNLNNHMTNINPNLLKTFYKDFSVPQNIEVKRVLETFYSTKTNNIKPPLIKSNSNHDVFHENKFGNYSKFRCFQNNKKNKISKASKASNISSNINFSGYDNHHKFTDITLNNEKETHMHMTQKTLNFDYTSLKTYYSNQFNLKIDNK